MLIGICDDVSKDRKDVYDICERFLGAQNLEHKYVMFSGGEEVLAYCKNTENSRIDLLFLDVEMNGISGIELKDIIIRSNLIWRIAFVSSHMESVFDAYGTKTIGFVTKPPAVDKIEKMITITQEELKDNVTITMNGYNGEIHEVKLEDIIYFKADGSYTEIYTNQSMKESQKYILITKKIGEIEEEFSQYPIVRIHKSYMVNLENVIDFGASVTMRNCEDKLPIGRSYKESTKHRYYEYGKNRIKKRL